MTYPTAIANFTRKVNRQSLVIAEDVNLAYDEIEAVERQLGDGGVLVSDAWSGSTALNKATTWLSLKARLQNIENGLLIAHDRRVATVGGSTITPSTAATTGLVVAGASSQSADLFRVESSTGTSFLKVSGAGVVTAIIDGGTA